MRTAIIIAVLVSCIGVWWVRSDGPAIVLELSDLQQLSQTLRGNDDRLIRQSPTEDTTRIQGIVCHSAIPSLVKTLVNSTQPLAVRGEAADVLHLCTTNNPSNRAKIGTVNSGKVFDGIKELIHASMKTWNATMPMVDSGRVEVYRTMDLVGKTVAQAAEAVWILSFNNERNQDLFFQAGIVDELVRTIQTCPIHFGHVSPCSEAVMWSLAALQNMAASYCDTEDGTCGWKRRRRSQDLFLPRGVYQTNNKRHQHNVDQLVRKRVLHFVEKEGFGELLNYLLCAGPVKEPHGKDFAWPSQAKDIVSEKRPEIIPWAVSALMSNLVLEPTARSHFVQQTEDNGHLFRCLCNMHQRSPDSLEATKSFDALYRLGWDEHCEDANERCDDHLGWVEAKTGKTCMEYEQERLCATMGNAVDKEDNMSAKEACCVCGGGEPKDGPTIDKKTEAMFQKMVVDGKW